jgi:2-hydroxychromene-2-carboxylate isomerase
MSPSIEFNFDISCPFAYIASTRISSLSSRTNTHINHRPVLLGAIYRATSAPQGAAGSASDVFNPTKRAVGQASMARTLKRYKIPYNPPAAHPMKSVDALRLLYCVHGEERGVLAEGLFAAYWVTGRDITSKKVLLAIARECGITGLNEASFSNPTARKDLEDATAQAIERGAFGVPGFWIPEARWADVDGEERTGRYIWGQDRMHFVEATVLAGMEWERVHGLRSLMPRCIPTNLVQRPTKLEFWFDFSSPWAFLGWTQLPRLKRAFPQLEIVLKPFLLGILFREIGAPNMPMLAVSATKAAWSRQDHADWTKWWNAVNEQEGGKDRRIDFNWAEVFPIRTPTVLRVGIVEPKTMGLLCESLHHGDVLTELVLIMTTQIPRVGKRTRTCPTRAYWQMYLQKAVSMALNSSGKLTPPRPRQNCVSQRQKQKSLVSVAYRRTASCGKTEQVVGNQLEA